MNDSFKEYLTNYLQSFGETSRLRYITVKIKEKYLKQAFAKATSTYDNAEVHLESLKQSTKLKHLETPIFYPEQPTERSEEYDREFTIDEGLEYTKTECSEWNLAGGLSLEYQGVGASSGIGYTRQQTKETKKIQATSQKKHINKQVHIPAKSSVTVVFTQQFQRKECRMSGIKLIFPVDAKLKCKFLSDADPQKTLKKEFLIKDILKDRIKNDKRDPLTAEMEGKYVWIETRVFLDIDRH